MNTSKKKTATGKVYEGMVELDDSYDVEESVTSSAVFLDTPDKKMKDNSRATSGESAVNGTLPHPPPPPPTLLGPSALLETSSDGLLETSVVVDDAMLGVAAAPVPPSSPPPPSSSPSRNPPEAPPSTPQGNRLSKSGASPTTKNATEADLSKVPTTITLPHSIDSSSSASGTPMPPLASPLDGEDEDDENGNGDPKNRLLRKGGGTITGGSRGRPRALDTSNGGSASSDAAAAAALRKRRRCLLLTALAALLVLAAVAGTLGYLLGTGTNNSTPGAAASEAPDPSSPGAGTTGNSTTPAQGQGQDGGDGGGGQDGGGNVVTTTSAPVAAPAPPTPAPTQMTDMYRVALQVTPQEVLDDPTTPQGMAIRWLLLPPPPSSSTNTSSSPVKYIPTTEDKLLQRYALTVLEMALKPNGGAASGSRRIAENSSADVVGGPIPGYEYMDECEWYGVVCATGGDPANSTDDAAASTSNVTTPNVTDRITALNWANRNMEGKIPTEIGLLSHLTALDFGNNQLRGWIPYSIYNLTNLQYLYLHQNQLSGPISDRISNLTQLIRFYAGNNQLTGTLPRGLGSAGRGAQYARPLRYLSLNYNKLGGQLPEDLYWFYMYYLDLGNNQFTGTFPVSWVGQMKQLSTLYLDFNRLTGSLPSNFTSTIGSGRLQQLIMSNNRLTGTMPGDFPVINFLQQLELHHNNFTEIDSQLCRQIVFLGGELVNMKADCDVCTCDYFCGQDQCVP